MSTQQRCAFILWIATLIHCHEFYQNENSEMAQILNRPVRALSFPSDSTMGLFFAIAVPLEDPERSVSLSYFFEANYDLPPNSTYFDPWYTANSRRRRSIGRTAVYEVLENKFETAGFPGRDCLLRSICETAETPIQHNGILGDIMHVIFTPSTSQKENLPEEIIEAEWVGRNGTCSKYYALCPIGLFDLIGTFVSS